MSQARLTSYIRRHADHAHSAQSRIPGHPLQAAAYRHDKLWYSITSAQMAKLVDAPASGAGACKGVEVRVFFWAPKIDEPRASNCTGLFLVHPNWAHKKSSQPRLDELTPKYVSTTRRPLHPHFSVAQSLTHTDSLWLRPMAFHPCYSHY
jgi:hypothetical protein